MCGNSILITGGAGFVGSTLALWLKRDFPSSNVVVIDNLKRRGSELNLPRLKSGGVEFVHGDVRNSEDLRIIVEPALIIDCSAEPSVMAGVGSSPEYVINTNLMGTVNCLELARNSGSKIMFLSTSRVYPIHRLNSLPIYEEGSRLVLPPSFMAQGVSNSGIAESFSLEGPRSIYGTTKLASEMMLAEYGDCYGVKGLINRCGVISGPWQMGKVDQGFIVLWVARHIFGGQLSYIGYGGKGKQVRDVLHIADLYDLVLRQIRSSEDWDCSIYNVGGGQDKSVSLLELTDIVVKETNSSIDIYSIPETRFGDIPYYVSDTSKVRDKFKWTPSLSLQDIVEDVARWISDNRESLSKILVE